MSVQLPVWDTIKAAWDKVSGFKSSFWAALGLIFVIMFAIGVLEGITERVMFISGLLGIIGSVLGYFLQMGLIYMGIARAKDSPISYKLVFSTFNMQIALYLIGLYILQTLIFIIPFIIGAAGFFLCMAGNVFATSIGTLLIIASIICTIVIAVRLSLAMAYVLDTLSAPLAAIKSSIAATEGNFWNLVGIYLLQLIILFVSMLLIIGWIWSLPLMFICYGMIYKTLRANV